MDQAADRDGSDMSGSRNSLRQGEADVDQRRPAKMSDTGDRCPDRLGDVAVQLRPELAAGDANPTLPPGKVQLASPSRGA
jgi:hypothetical protein